MQRPSEAKRIEIMGVATGFFATRPYHEVRIDDIAAAAKVGKGTVYTYFESKDALYLALIREGFAKLVEGVRADLAKQGAGTWERLGRIVSGLVDFGFSFPDLFRVLRSGVVLADDPELQRTRLELYGIIEVEIRAGAAAGDLVDPHPELTARYLLSFVRGALLYPPPGLTPAALKEHMLRLVRRGLGTGALS